MKTMTAVALVGAVVGGAVLYSRHAKASETVSVDRQCGPYAPRIFETGPDVLIQLYYSSTCTTDRAVVLDNAAVLDEAGYCYEADQLRAYSDELAKATPADIAILQYQIAQSGLCGPAQNPLVQEDAA